MFHTGRVNLILTKQSIRYAYQKGAGLDAITHYGEQLLPDGTMKNGAIQNRTQFQDAVKFLVRKHHWKRKKLVFCLVDDTVFIQDMVIPGAVTKDEAIAYIKTQEGHEIELPFDDSAMAVDILKERHKSTSVRLYAYPQEKIDKIKQAFAACGLVPVFADLTFLSVYRYYVHTVPKAPNHVLVIHWNRAGLYLTIFNRDRAVFNRHIKVSIPEDATKESVEPIIREYITDISRMVDFYHTSVIKSSAQVEELIVTGDSLYLGVIKQFLTEALGLPVYDFPKDVGGKHDNKRFTGGSNGRSTRMSAFNLELVKEDKLEAKYIDLFGLALRSDASKPKKEVPTRQTTLDFLARKKKRVKLSRYLFFIVVLLLLATAVVMWTQWDDSKPTGPSIPSDVQVNENPSESPALQDKPKNGTKRKG